MRMTLQINRCVVLHFWVNKHRVTLIFLVFSIYLIKRWVSALQHPTPQKTCSQWIPWPWLQRLTAKFWSFFYISANHFTALKIISQICLARLSEWRVRNLKAGDPSKLRGDSSLENNFSLNLQSTNRCKHFIFSTSNCHIFLE